MVNPAIAKAGMKAAVPGPDATQAVEKARPSKFDEIRTELAQKVASDLQMPPAAQISQQQKGLLENALRKRLSGTNATSAADLFGVERKNAQARVQNLVTAVNKLPQDQSTSPIRARLQSIEEQYQQSGKLIDNAKDMDPQSLLKIQMQMYQLSENVGILAKVVDQVNSGVKQILQTQL